MKYLGLLFAMILGSSYLPAQEKIVNNLPKTNILFVLDGSQSMLAQWGSGNKMEVATTLLSELIDSLANLNHVSMALRVYGHQRPVPPQDCDDTKLEVPFGAKNGNTIKNKLGTIKPKGTTPIAHSLELSANDFPKCNDCRNIIILITDGIESCDGDPCAVSLQLQKQGIILKPFVIGVGLDTAYNETFDCVGRYYNATNEDRFKEILQVVVSQALNNTSLQINLLNSDGKPTESNVNMTFYDEISGEMIYNFIHTINKRGNPDTLRIDPIPTYKIEVHTLPKVSAEGITLVPGEHNTVSIKAPQGLLLVKAANENYYNELQILVRESGNCQTLNIQKINYEEKYIVGNYDIEVLTTPKLVFNNLEIKQSATSIIYLPQPGLITFVGSAQAYGAIYKVINAKLEWVCNLNHEKRNQTIALQPGNYRVISRPKNARESVFTSNISFIVASEISEKIILF